MYYIHQEEKMDIKCIFGFHDWVEVYIGNQLMEGCSRCNMIRQISR